MEELLERGVFDMAELAAGGWLTALRYEDEVVADLKKRTGGKADRVRAVRRRITAVASRPPRWWWNARAPC